MSVHRWRTSSRPPMLVPCGDPGLFPPEIDLRVVLRRLVDDGELGRVELGVVDGGDGVLELCDRAGADDDRGDPRVAQYPGHRELCQRLTAVVRDLVKAADDVQALGGEQALRQVAALRC